MLNTEHDAVLVGFARESTAQGSIPRLKQGEPSGSSHSACPERLLPARLSVLGEPTVG